MRVSSQKGTFTGQSKNSHPAQSGPEVHGDFKSFMHFYEWRRETLTSVPVNIFSIPNCLIDYEKYLQMSEFLKIFLN